MVLLLDQDALSKVQAEKQTQATELKRLQGFKQEHTAATEQLKQVVATLTADNEEMSRTWRGEWWLYRV